LVDVVEVVDTTIIDARLAVDAADVVVAIKEPAT